MKKTITILIFLIAFTAIKSQIFAPEGLNIPGQFNGWTNPPTKLVFASNGQVTGGKVTKISVGTTRWQTIFSVDSGSKADTDTGTYNFLFTSGSSTNYYQNKWAGTTVVVDSLQSYTYNTGADNRVKLTRGWYTMNWEDNGYANNKAIFMRTTSTPISITSVTRSPATPVSSIDVTVTITLSAAKSSEEIIYLRYTNDNWKTDSVLQATGSNTTYTATIPKQPLDTTVRYYAFTSTKANIKANHDLYTINNNNGNRYLYRVQTHSLFITNVSRLQVCQESSLGLTYGFNGGFNAGNKFIFELSDSTGSFAFPNILDSIASTTAGSTFVLIPKSIPQGGGYRIRLRSTNPALTSVNNGQNITILTLPTRPTITQGATVSGCDSVTLTSSPAPTGYTYNWKFHGGGGPFPATQSIKVGKSGPYKIVHLGNCSDSSAVTTVTITAGFVATISPSGSQRGCAGDSLVYSANTGTGLNYEWRKDGIAIPNSNKNSYAAKTNGTYTVKVSDGSCSLVSPQSQLTFETKPVANFTITGDTILCAGDSVVFNALAVTANYIWQRNKTTLNTFNNKRYAANQSGKYRLLVNAGVTFGTCADTSKETEVKIYTSFTASARIAQGKSMFCIGDSAVLEALGGRPGANYQWVRNNTNIFNAQRINYTVTNGGNYKVIIANGNCKDTSQTIGLFASTTPQLKPTITSPSVGVLECVVSSSAVRRYNWFRNGVKQTDSTKTITVSTNGCYRCTMVDSINCETLRADSVCTALGIQTPESAFGIKIYPNPAKNTLYISNNNNIIANVLITDLQGRSVLAFVLKEAVETNIAHLAQGVYIIRISNGINIATQKLLVE